MRQPRACENASVRGAANRAAYAWALLGVVGMVCLLQGCAAYDYLYGKPPRRETQQSDQELMRSAEGQLQRGRYEDARKDLQRLMNQYPDSDLVRRPAGDGAGALPGKEI
jgi:outer membrane protein assembly factor BamD (BamD/ComL family)